MHRMRLKNMFRKWDSIFCVCTRLPKQKLNIEFSSIQVTKSSNKFHKKRICPVVEQCDQCCYIVEWTKRQFRGEMEFFHIMKFTFKQLSLSALCSFL